MKECTDAHIAMIGIPGVSYFPVYQGGSRICLYSSLLSCIVGFLCQEPCT